MLDATKQSQLQDQIEQAQSIIVLLGSNPSNDEVAAALGLTEALKDSGKSVTIAAPRHPQTKLSLIGAEQISTELGNQNLSISFAYSETAVDKVSYHISDDNSRFFLTIKPKKGQQPLDAESVEVGYAGAEADLIVVLGVQELGELGKLHSSYEELYQNTPIVTVGERAAQFGTLQLTLTDEVGVSQLLAGSLFDIGSRLGAAAATNFLAGIESVTGNLQSPKATAETFEVVARLMRAGAERARRQQQEESESRGESQPTSNSKKSQQNTIQVEQKQPSNKSNSSEGEALGKKSGRGK